jgi:hypothetical protein
MESLIVLWTTDNKDTFFNMINMYAVNSLKHNWWEDITVIIWGASAKLAGADVQVQLEIMEMIQQGVKVEACKACADICGVSETLEKLGVQVRYMGAALTEILKSDKKLLTI